MSWTLKITYVRATSTTLTTRVRLVLTMLSCKDPRAARVPLVTAENTAKRLPSKQYLEVVTRATTAQEALYIRPTTTQSLAVLEDDVLKETSVRQDQAHLRPAQQETTVRKSFWPQSLRLALRGTTAVEGQTLRDQLRTLRIKAIFARKDTTALQERQQQLHVRLGSTNLTSVQQQRVNA